MIQHRTILNLFIKNWTEVTCLCFEDGKERVTCQSYKKSGQMIRCEHNLNSQPAHNVQCIPTVVSRLKKRHRKHITGVQRTDVSGGTSTRAHVAL